MLIKPFTAQVNSLGQAMVQVEHSLHGLVWKVYQIGMSLNEAANLAQCAAHINGIPLSGAVYMQPCQFPGVPYRMESYFTGPPYIVLSAGDFILCSVINATPGDTFTAGAYVEERPASANLSMGS
jgi:hypothetical protein